MYCLQAQQDQAAQGFVQVPLTVELQAKQENPVVHPLGGLQDVQYPGYVLSVVQVAQVVTPHYAPTFIYPETFAYVAQLPGYQLLFGSPLKHTFQGKRVLDCELVREAQQQPEAHGLVV